MSVRSCEEGRRERFPTADNDAGREEREGERREKEREGSRSCNYWRVRREEREKGGGGVCGHCQSTCVRAPGAKPKMRKPKTQPAAMKEEEKRERRDFRATYL